MARGSASMVPMKLRTALACIALAAVSGLAPAGAATVAVEVESATNLVAPMVAVRQEIAAPGTKVLADASAGAYLEVPLGAGKTPKVKAGKATLAVEVPEDGSYTLWLRAYWQGECSNSLQVQIDKGPLLLVGEDGTYNTWHWVKYPVSKLASPTRLTKGRHTLTLVHREDGIHLDQLLLTSDARFVPVGIEQTGVRP